MSIAMLALTDAEKSEVLREAYRQHAAELLAIEESQFKLTTVLLGIFGAGASFLAAMKNSPPCRAKIGLTVVVVAIVMVGAISTYLRHRARTGTRVLLVRCEEALGFKHLSAYIPDQALYPDRTSSFPQKGWWLGLTYLFVAIAATGFLVLLWSL
jgi:hypothetical protein